jgi:hypothetical protein
VVLEPRFGFAVDDAVGRFSAREQKAKEKQNAKGQADQMG